MSDARPKRKYTKLNLDDPWVHPVSKATVFDDDELDDALTIIAKEQWGYKAVHGKHLWWTRKGLKARKKTADQAEQLYCTYHHQSKCPWQIRRIRDALGNNSLYVPEDLAHSNHALNYFKSMPPKQIYEVFNSPSDANLKPSNLLRKNLKRGLYMTEEEQVRYKRALANRSKAIRQSSSKENDNPSSEHQGISI